MHDQDPAHDQLFAKIIAALPILADVSRSDLLLFRYPDARHAVVVGQAQPHSILPLYSDSLVGKTFTASELPAIFAPRQRLLWRETPRPATLNGAPIVRQVRAVRDAPGHVIGALSVETNALAFERHRRRSRVFQRAVDQLQWTALAGELCDACDLSEFGEHDGIYLVDVQRRIRYVSGIAANFFRRLGYLEDLVGERVGSLATGDAPLVERALASETCVEEESEEQGLIWIRKALPVRAQRGGNATLRRLGSALGLGARRSAGSFPVGVLVTIHDDTEARRQAQELKVKLALIQEVHHRVKNNLQTIASLLRLQSRRVASDEAQALLQEATNRILSIAVVHEYLSQAGGMTINIRDIARRIIAQMRDSLLEPGKEIRFELQGPNIYLSARQATACALVMNELLQNAVEHGYRRRDRGNVVLALEDEGEQVHLTVRDDGDGLPPDFDLAISPSLGLRIVQALVNDDLHGRLALTSEGSGTLAAVTFAKQMDGSERI